MQQHEYNVILNDGVDYNAFWNEMETQGHISPAVPDRIVTIVNERPVSLRQCHYSLTDNEVELLKSDLRVYDIEIPPDNRTDLDNRHCAGQLGNFSQYYGASNDKLNWGLFRCQDSNNSNANNAYPGYYNYILDGTGVDIVIMDTGIQADHPDFQDANGVSRVQQINWFAASGVSGSMPANFYTDLDGHGTHCAGIAAGKTYGWAKNARIYAMHIALSGDPGAGNAIAISTAMDCIRGWHLNKPVDSATGARRPTVVNMSWGNFDNFNTNFDGVEYRGNDYGDAINTDLGMVGINGGFGGQNSSYDTNLSELLDAGIHVAKAAGNNNNTVDVPGGPDFNNNVFNEIIGIQFNRRYYQRGPSPRSGREVNVGAMDTNPYTDRAGDKAYFSNSGPGIDIWAPGYNIMSTISTSNTFGQPYTYPPNPSFKIASISGTSMAAPQVAGLLACFAQIWPQASVTWLKNKLITLAATNQMTETTQTNYTNSYSLHSGPNLVMYPGTVLSTAVNSATTGAVGIRNISIR